MRTYLYPASVRKSAVTVSGMRFASDRSEIIGILWIDMFDMLDMGTLYTEFEYSSVATFEN